MNRFTQSALLLILSATTLPSFATGLDVEVDGLGSEGQAMLELYSSRVSFPEQPRETMSAPISNGRAHWRFDDLPPGDYAVMVWDDADADGKFDRSMFGRAKEAFAFSNGVTEIEPDWDAIRVTVGGDTLTVRLTTRIPE